MSLEFKLHLVTINLKSINKNISILTLEKNNDFNTTANTERTR